MVSKSVYMPPATRQEIQSVLVGTMFSTAVGACLEHTMQTGNEGGFTLHRSQAYENQGKIINAPLLLPQSPEENDGSDPTRSLMIPMLGSAVGNFHSHPYSAWFRAHSVWPSHRDILNVTEHPDFGVGHVHGVLGREESGTESTARMHLLRVPIDAGDVSQAGRSYAAFFNKASRTGAELGEHFSRFGIGHVALAITVHNGRATFDFDSIGGTEAVLDQLYVNS